jgi:hypothetical protein
MKAIPEFTGDELTVTRKNWLQYINVYFYIGSIAYTYTNISYTFCIAD